MFFVLNRIHKDKSFHCDVCNVCLDKRLEGKHKCRPDSGHDECCICLEVGEDLLFFTKKTWLHVHPRQLCICQIAKFVLLLNLHEVDKGGGNKWPLGTKSCFVDMVEHQWCSTASSFRFFVIDGLISTTNKTFLSEVPNVYALLTDSFDKPSLHSSEE